MKKLIYLICIVALFFTGTLATAQSTFPDRESHTSESTFGRFGSDVDLFFSVNDWADLEFSKWFGFLRMQDIGAANWDSGIALKFENAYLGFYYRGQYNSGTSPDLKVTTHSPTGTTVTGVTAIPGNTIDHNNNFGFLLGMGDNGFKLTIEDRLTTRDLPLVTVAGTYTDNKGDSHVIPAGTNYYYKSRGGWITPKLQWGAAKDLEFGKYTSRPSAAVALAIEFNETEVGGFRDTSGNPLLNADGTPRFPETIEDFRNNFFTPVLGFDTGAINFFKGDWGALSFGVSDEFSVRIQGEGSSQNTIANENAGTLPWRNRLMPYATFSYLASDYFKVGAQLSVPMYFAWNGTDNSYFAIGGSSRVGTNFAGGASGDSWNMVDKEANPTRGGDLPALDFGFQFSCAFFDSISGKTTILSRMVINWGIKANLPGYASYGTYTHVPAPAPSDPDNPQSTVTITHNKTKEWFRPTALQSFNSGISFFLTDKVVLDATIDTTYTPASTPAVTNFNWMRWGFTETVVLGSLMITVKH